MLLLKRIVTPFQQVNIPTAVFVSPLDVIAGNVGYTAVEQVFRDNHGVRGIVGALVRYFDDEKAELVLKKTAHLAIEQRLRVLALRVDPPCNHGFSNEVQVPMDNHPLDDQARMLLSQHDKGVAKLPRRRLVLAQLRLLTSVFIRGFLFLTQASYLYWRYGRKNVRVATYRMGTPNTINNARWAPLRAAAEEAGVWTKDAIFVVIDDPGAVTVPADWLPYARLHELPLDRTRWRGEVLGPGFRLVLHVLACALKGMGNPWVQQLALESMIAAKESLAVRRLAHNFRFEFFIDVEEYTQRHIIKAMVLGADGAKLVRWAKGIMDAPGAALTYLAYELFLASGPNIAHTYGASWLPTHRAVSVGLISNDSHMTKRENVGDEYRNVIEDHISRGGRLAVWFPPSDIEGMDVLFESTIKAIIPQFADRQDWLLLIKPKGLKAGRMLERVLGRSSAVLDKKGSLEIVVVKYKDRDGEICPAGWLIQKMCLGLAFSTVQLESLIQGKPTIGYYPVIHKSPLTEHLVARGLLHDAPDSFAAAIRSWLDGAGPKDIPTGWLRENFDPFGDDQALTRIARMLFDDQ